MNIQFLDEIIEKLDFDIETFDNFIDALNVEIELFDVFVERVDFGADGFPLICPLTKPDRQSYARLSFLSKPCIKRH